MESVEKRHHYHLSHRRRENIELAVKLLPENIQVILKGPDNGTFPEPGIGHLKIRYGLLEYLNFAAVSLTDLCGIRCLCLSRLILIRQ